MHLKNWSVIYPDGRTPTLAPGYDFVSTIQYTDDRSLALSIAREKDTGRLDEALLEKFATRARIPKALVTETALHTLENLKKAWSELAPDLPLDKRAREKLETQFQHLPLMRDVVNSVGQCSPQ
jgi:serine/threonine-protein kinase HipA